MDDLRRDLGDSTWRTPEWKGSRVREGYCPCGHHTKDHYPVSLLCEDADCTCPGIDREVDSWLVEHDAQQRAKGAEQYQLNRQANLDAIKDMFTPTELAAVYAYMYTDVLAVPDAAHEERVRELDRQYGWSKRFALLAPQEPEETP